MTDPLHRFRRELNRAFDGPASLLPHALGLIAKSIPLERIACFRLDAPRRVLAPQLRLRRGIAQEFEEELHLVDSSPLSQLMDGRKDSVASATPRPILFVPLGAGGPEPPTGALRLERAPGRPFTAGQRGLALQFAAELGQSLRQAELSQVAQRQLRRLEALTELTAIFATSLRVDDGLKLILQGIQRHLALDRVRLYLVDRAAKKLRGELSVDMRGGVRSLRREELALAAGEHRFVDILLNSSAAPVLEGPQRTLLHVPLTVQGVGTGLLVMDNLISQEPIDAEDVELLRSFAGQIALAVDNARLFDEVQALSLYDSLTSLPVRRYFMQRFQEELYRAQRSNQELAVALIDMDHFKGINDTYGHQVGDQVLQELGRVILAGLRRIDMPCRYGGDEIILLLPQCGEAEAVKIMSRLAQAVREARVPVPFSKAREVAITASIGIAVYPADGRTIEELILHADEALYWVKSKGRDGVASHSQSIREAKPAAESRSVPGALLAPGTAPAENDPGVEP